MVGAVIHRLSMPASAPAGSKGVTTHSNRAPFTSRTRYGQAAANDVHA